MDVDHDMLRSLIYQSACISDVMDSLNALLETGIDFDPAAFGNIQNSKVAMYKKRKELNIKIDALCTLAMNHRIPPGPPQGG